MDTKYIAVGLIVLGICVLLAYDDTRFDIYCGIMSCLTDYTYFWQDDCGEFHAGYSAPDELPRLLHWK